jgi:hypothetical protein
MPNINMIMKVPLAIILLIMIRINFSGFESLFSQGFSMQVFNPFTPGSLLKTLMLGAFYSSILFQV